jgi:hypothetical protein
MLNNNEHVATQTVDVKVLQNAGSEKMVGADQAAGTL